MKCVPCEGGVPKLTPLEINQYLQQVNQHWQAQGDRIHRTFITDDFMSALNFANRIAPIAEEEGHHPDLHIYWGKIEVVLWTHAIGGLSENDFILAAKIDQKWLEAR